MLYAVLKGCSLAGRTEHLFSVQTNRRPRDVYLCPQDNEWVGVKPVFGCLLSQSVDPRSLARCVHANLDVSYVALISLPQGRVKDTRKHRRQQGEKEREAEIARAEAADLAAQLRKVRTSAPRMFSRLDELCFGCSSGVVFAQARKVLSCLPHFLISFRFLPLCALSHHIWKQKW